MTRDSKKGETTRDAITVAIVSQRPSLLASLLAHLGSARDYRVIGHRIRDTKRLGSVLEHDSPQLLLLDKRWLDRQPVDSMQAVRARFPRLRVLVLCDRHQSGLLEAVLRSGFHGFVLTSSTPATFAKAIRSVSRGELWLPRAMLERVVLDAQTPNPLRAVDARLTRRETQAVAYLCRGFTNKEIADELGIREDTVKKHLHNVYGKLGIQRRTQLIARHAAKPSSSR